MKQAKELYEYNSSHGYPIMTYELVTSFTITYHTDCMISLYQDDYSFTGGAHGSTIRHSQNWNLQIGKQFSLNTLYPNNPYFLLPILQQINKQIEQQIASGSNTYFDHYCQLVLETFQPTNFYITSDSIIFFFQQYDIAPYSSGIPTFSLPNK